MPSATGGLSGLEWFGLISNAVSLVVGVLAIWLSWQFYRQTNDTERRVETSLTKIEAQTKSLQTLSAKWLDKLTNYVTTDRTAPTDRSVAQLVETFAQLPQVMLTQLRMPSKEESSEELIDELLACYVALYYYTALTNYWSQFYLPDKTDFDVTNDFHSVVKRIVDGSEADFQHMGNVLGKADQSRLDKVSNAAIKQETQRLWRHHVRTANEVYADRTNPAEL
jgi:uncharacterized membrane-anchored protein YhcB (DUF1043 family)